MPELDILHAWTCESNLFWTRKISSSAGDKTYDVTWRRNLDPSREYSYGWHCSCPAFQYGRGKYCKHILSVDTSGQRCGWNAELEPTLSPARSDSDPDYPECPSCGGDIRTIPVGV
jgi:hypothetical protein